MFPSMTAPKAKETSYQRHCHHIIIVRPATITFIYFNAFNVVITSCRCLLFVCCLLFVIGFKLVIVAVGLLWSLLLRNYE